MGKREHVSLRREHVSLKREHVSLKRVHLIALYDHRDLTLDIIFRISTVYSVNGMHYCRYTIDKVSEIHGGRKLPPPHPFRLTKWTDI